MKLKGIFVLQSHFFKLMLLIFFIAFFGIIGTFLISILSALDLGLGLTDFNEIMDFSDPKKLKWLKVIQVTSQISMFLIPAVITVLLISNKPANYLHLKKPLLLNQVILILVFILASVPIINLLAELNNNITLPEFAHNLENWFREKEDAAQVAAEAFLKMESINSLLFNVFMIGIVAALSEELLFRGVIQKMFSDISKNYHIGIWVTAIFFSAMHMQFFGFVPRMLLGALFGYMLVWSGTLWLPVIAHFIYNTTVVISIYFINRLKLPIDQDTIGTKSEDIIFLIPCIIICGSIIIYFYKNRNMDEVFTLNNNGSINTDPNLIN